eukprot:2679102-Rhodomonas_salina.4
MEKGGDHLHRRPGERRRLLLWGSGLAEAITTSSGRLDIHVASSQKFKLQDEESIDHAVKEVAQTNVRVIVFMVRGYPLYPQRHSLSGTDEYRRPIPPCARSRIASLVLTSSDGGTRPLAKT